MKNAPKHVGANDVLQKGLEGKDGAIRRATAMLAFEMNEFEVLESMSAYDHLDEPVWSPDCPRLDDCQC